jgi:hypothetical protein
MMLDPTNAGISAAIISRNFKSAARASLISTGRIVTGVRISHETATALIPQLDAITKAVGIPARGVPRKRRIPVRQ